MLSVNTNTNAMTSLEYLSQTEGQLTQTENAISSGETVATAKDNGAVYAIAQNMRGDVAAYSAVTESLDNGESVVGVALSAGQSISDLLIQMKQQALSASDASLDTTSRQALNANFQALMQQITTIVQNAQFNGTNLIDGSTAQISAIASADGQHRVTVSAENMSLSGSIVTIATTGSISTAARASAMIATVDASLTNVDSALATLGSGSAKLSVQATFVQNLSDSLTTGIGNLVDANMATESSQLTALQTKQQLGVQALSIANQMPQILLSLFH
jgi:flagellin